MSFGIPVRNGLPIGLGTTVSFNSGAGAGGRARRDQPTLIIDFVSPSTSGESLSLDFIPAPTGAYSAFTPDTSQPQAGFINIQVWN